MGDYIPVAPVASFTNTTTTATLNTGESLQVNFTSTSTNSPTNITWDLDGDSIADTYGNTTHWNYTASGNVTIHMKATNADGFDWENKTITLSLTFPPASISSPPGNVTVDEMVLYSQTFTADQGGNWTLNTTAEWLSLASNVLSGTPDSFDGGHSYNVSMAITNDNGTAYANWTITVTDSFDAFVEDGPIDASYGDRYIFDADTDKELDGIAINYSFASNWYAVKMNSTTGEFDFDVSDTGTYWINVTATDAEGKTSWMNWSVTVNMLGWNLDVEITYEEAAYYRVQFYYEFEGNESLIKWAQWNFGDGNGSKDESPVHVFDGPGTYLITVALFDELGGIGYTTKEITIGGETPDTVKEKLDWWVENKLTGLVFVVIGGIVAAALYVALAKRHGGANKLVIGGIAAAVVMVILWYLEALA